MTDLQSLYDEFSSLIYPERISEIDREMEKYPLEWASPNDSEECILLNERNLEMHNLLSDEKHKLLNIYHKRRNDIVDRIHALEKELPVGSVLPKDTTGFFERSMINGLNHPLRDLDGGQNSTLWVTINDNRVIISEKMWLRILALEYASALDSFFLDRTSARGEITTKRLGDLYEAICEQPSQRKLDLEKEIPKSSLGFGRGRIYKRNVYEDVIKKQKGDVLHLMMTAGTFSEYISTSEFEKQKERIKSSQARFDAHVGPLPPQIYRYFPHVYEPRVQVWFYSSQQPYDMSPFDIYTWVEGDGGFLANLYP